MSLWSDSRNPFTVVNLIENIIKKANYKISSPVQGHDCESKKSTQSSAVRERGTELNRGKGPCSRCRGARQLEETGTYTHTLGAHKG